MHYRAGGGGGGGGGAVGTVGEEEKREVKDEAQFTNRFSLTASLFLFFFFPIAKLGLSLISSVQFNSV